MAFEVVELAEDDELYTLNGLMNNKHPRQAQPSSPSSTSTRSSETKTLETPLLKRGRSIRADQFLDSLVRHMTRNPLFNANVFHLQNIAFEALHRGTLHALRIPFMGDPDVNSNPLELWSFRVIYKHSAENRREVQGLEADLGSDETYDPSLCVIDLLEKVSEQCERLPQLPGEMHIELLFVQRLD